MKNWLTLVENSRESLTTSRVDSAEDRIIGLKDLDKISGEYIYIYVHIQVSMYIQIYVKNIYTHVYMYIYT